MNKKWFVGIDVSKSTLDVTLFIKADGDKSPHGQFVNDDKGCRAIIRWLRKQGVNATEVLFCMEHTGVYSMGVAMFFENNNLVYSMVSPLHIKRSLGLVRGKSDKVDSFHISRFCYLHREELSHTKLPFESIRMLKSLINERERLVKIQKSEKTVLHELEKTNTRATTKRIKARITMISKHINCIEKEMEQIIASEPDISENYKLIRSVRGQ